MDEKTLLYELLYTGSITSIKRIRDNIVYFRTLTDNELFDFYHKAYNLSRNKINIFPLPGIQTPLFKHLPVSFIKEIMRLSILSINNSNNFNIDNFSICFCIAFIKELANLTELKNSLINELNNFISTHESEALYLYVKINGFKNKENYSQIQLYWLLAMNQRERLWNIYINYLPAQLYLGALSSSSGKQIGEMLEKFYADNLRYSNLSEESMADDKLVNERNSFIEWYRSFKNREEWSALVIDKWWERIKELSKQGEIVLYDTPSTSFNWMRR